MKSLIIDLETLGIAQKSVILQITAAIVDSDLSSTETFNAKLDAKAQALTGRTIEKSTLSWWESQNEEAKRRAFYPNKELDLLPIDALDAFIEFLKQNKFNAEKCFVWQRGDKDSLWLTDLFMDNGWIFDKIPFKWWKVRDIRTCVDVLGQSSRLNGYPDNSEDLIAQIPGYAKHDAISDVNLEVLILKQCGVIGGS